MGTKITVVERPHYRRFLQGSGPRLAYGRRKTGKTLYARHVLPNHSYYIVRRGGRFLDPRDMVEYDVRQFLQICRREEALIIDEFHRAPGEFMDALHAGECLGPQLVLLTSTLHYHRRFTQGPEAPLQGLLAQRQVGLVSPRDLLAHPWGVEPGRELVERLVFYQEPTLIGRSLDQIILDSPPMARSLVGEVLEEEDHALTMRYNAILEALASGHNRITHITGHLAARGLLDHPQPGSVSKYLHLMARLGLVERVPLWGRERHYYRHASPLTWASYYLTARYGLGEVPLPPGFVEKAARALIPQLVEVFVERLLAELHGLRPVKILHPTEVDVALAHGRRIKLVAEVKWVNRLTRSDVRKAESKLASYEEARHLLIVPDPSQVPETSLEVLGPRELVEISRSQQAKPI